MTMKENTSGPYTLSSAQIYAGLSLILILCLDLFVPHGIGIGSLYLISLFLIIYESRKVILIFSSIIFAVLLAEVLVYYSRDLPLYMYSNRGISMVVLVVANFMALKHSRANKARRRDREKYNKTIEAKGQELLQKEKRYHDALDNMIEGVQIISTDWKYIYVNDSVAKQSKQRKEDLVGSTMMERFPGIENSMLFSTLQTCMSERVVQYFENEFVYADGSKGYFELSIQPVPEGLFILSMDISERKKNEQHREQRINELEEMMFIVSHKVRQPVAHILGVASLLDGQQQPGETELMVEYIKQSAASLDSMTKELSDYIHNTKGNKR